MNPKNFLKISGFIALILLMMESSMYYMMPFHAINPHEYFTSNDLRQFQIYDLFVTGVAIPFAAVISGYFIKEFNIGAIALFKALLVTLIIATFMNGHDSVWMIIVALLLGVMITQLKWVFQLTLVVVLYSTYLLLDLFPKILSYVQSEYNHVYSAIQDVNTYTFVYRSIDYFRMISLNLDILTGNIIHSIYMIVFTILPFVIIGSLLYQLRGLNILNRYKIVGTILIGLLIIGGLSLKLIHIVSLGALSTQLIAMYVGGPIFALGLIGVTMFLSHIDVKFLRSNILTGYIFYSLIMVIVYYGIGFTLYGEMELIHHYILVIGVFVCTLFINSMNVIEKWILSKNK